MKKATKTVVKKILDWDTMGQFANVLLNVFTHARDVFAKMGIEPIKIVPWLVGDGKQAFGDALTALGEKYRSTQRIRLTNNKNVIWVNLDAPPKLPFDGAEPKPIQNAPSGWVKVELKKGSTYVDGHKLAAYLDDGQKDGEVMQGHKLAEALTGKPVEHPNVLDALCEYPHLVADELKKDGQGRTIYLFFWAVKFRYRDGNLYVRYGYWDDGGFRSDYYWLDFRWGDRDPAAVRAS